MKTSGWKLSKIIMPKKRSLRQTEEQEQEQVLYLSSADIRLRYSDTTL